MTRDSELRVVIFRNALLKEACVAWNQKIMQGRRILNKLNGYCPI